MTYATYEDYLLSIALFFLIALLVLLEGDYIKLKRKTWERLELMAIFIIAALLSCTATI